MSQETLNWIIALSALVGIIITCGTIIFNVYRHSIKLDLRVEAAFNEMQSVKLIINQHTDEISEIKNRQAYDAGFRKGQHEQP
jgi:uncharacterized membrane-anchored protein YhcB (DUF1043 family)